MRVVHIDAKIVVVGETVAIAKITEWEDQGKIQCGQCHIIDRFFKRFDVPARIHHISDEYVDDKLYEQIIMRIPRKYWKKIMLRDIEVIQEQE